MVNSSVINISNLPNILSDDEFNYYFRKFTEGNLDVLDNLVKHNIKLVYWYIENYVKCDYFEYDDIFSVGLEALIEALYRFDFSYNVMFSTFAITCIKNKILKYFRSANKHKKL